MPDSNYKGAKLTHLIKLNSFDLYIEDPFIITDSKLPFPSVKCQNSFYS